MSLFELREPERFISRMSLRGMKLLSAGKLMVSQLLQGVVEIVTRKKAHTSLAILNRSLNAICLLSVGGSCLHLCDMQNVSWRFLDFDFPFSRCTVQ